MFKKLAVVGQFAALGLIVSGCTSFNSLRPMEKDIRHSLRGKTTEDILECLGPASNTHSEGSLEVWTYPRKRCTVNVNFRNGVISKLSYREPSGMPISDPGRCEVYLQNCTQTN